MESVQTISRPPRIPGVVRRPAPEELVETVDWSSWYLSDEEDMGQSPEQSEIIDTLDCIVRKALEEAGESSWYVGTDAFFAWIPGEPLVRVSPDVYVQPRMPPSPLPRSWQTWLPEHSPPTICFEIVSEEWKKDYEVGPDKYAMLGVVELVIFDPRIAVRGQGAERFALQLYRRTRDGLFVRRYAGPGPVELETLGAYAVVVQTDRGARLRLSRDSVGRDLVPTPLEERDAADRARAAAEQENERLRAEIKKLRG